MNACKNATNNSIKLRIPTSARLSHLPESFTNVEIGKKVKQLRGKKSPKHPYSRRSYQANYLNYQKKSPGSPGIKVGAAKKFGLGKRKKIKMKSRPAKISPREKNDQQLNAIKLKYDNYEKTDKVKLYYYK